MSNLLFKSMDQESMLETCISDYCYCSHENREKCACDGVSVFAKDCLFQGVKLNSEWRNLEICRKYFSFTKK